MKYQAVVVRFLLDYFDEPLEQKCGNCDLCVEPATTWDGTEAARKALSCIYRTGQLFGVSHLIDVLLGKQTAKVQQFHHDQLTTFGIGADYKQAEWRSIFRQLVARGYVNVDLEGHGSLKLNNRCRPLLKGEETIEFRQDRYEYATVKTIRVAAPSEKGRLVVEEQDKPLWEALRTLRRELAEEQGVPAYVIFNDKTLLGMLKARPENLTDLSQVSGVGEFKLEHYGEAFCRLISEHCSTEASS